MSTANVQFVTVTKEQIAEKLENRVRTGKYSAIKDAVSGLKTGEGLSLKVPEDKEAKSFAQSLYQSMRKIAKVRIVGNEIILEKIDIKEKN